MKAKHLFTIVSAVFLIGVISQNSMATGAKEQIASIIRTMGYGGAIHNFKNFVLRGTGKYRTRAEKQFGEVVAIVGSLRDEKAVDPAALDGIEQVATAYKNALATIEKLHQEGKRVAEIDKAVKISDGPATKGIKTLRQGVQWSMLEELEYAMGYGNAIHAFKNYVIRGAEKYHGAAKVKFGQVLELAAEMREAGQDAAALDGIEKVVKSYLGAVDAVEELVGDGKSPEEIDKAVKISDKPAKEGLAVLLGK